MSEEEKEIFRNKIISMIKKNVKANHLKITFEPERVDADLFWGSRLLAHLIVGLPWADEEEVTYGPCVRLQAMKDYAPKPVVNKNGVPVSTLMVMKDNGDLRKYFGGPGRFFGKVFNSRSARLENYEAAILKANEVFLQLVENSEDFTFTGKVPEWFRDGAIYAQEQSELLVKQGYVGDYSKKQALADRFEEANTDLESGNWRPASFSIMLMMDGLIHIHYDEQSDIAFVHDADVRVYNNDRDYEYFWTWDREGNKIVEKIPLVARNLDELIVMIDSFVALFVERYKEGESKGNEIDG